MRGAFSLVELSIVLVILGLLTGGVLTGQHLIQSAILRKVPKDIADFQAAIYQYQDIYDALAGDHSDAYKYFNHLQCGRETNDGGEQISCNGNGNGRIDGSPVGHGFDTLRIWRHLMLAELIQPRGLENGVEMNQKWGWGRGGGYYKTFAVAVDDESNQGNHGISPSVPISPFGYGTGYAATRNFGQWQQASPGPYGYVDHAFILAGFRSNSEGAVDMNLGGVMTADQARHIDAKMDDGIPHKGDVMARGGVHGSTTGCLTRITGATDMRGAFAGDERKYKIDDDTESCILFIKFDT